MSEKSLDRDIPPHESPKGSTEGGSISPEPGQNVTHALELEKELDLEPTEDELATLRRVAAPIP